MESYSGHTRPFWTHDTEPVLFERLDHDIRTDICVIGGGIAGVSIAYTLAQQGRNVVLLEKNAIGCGETSRSTAHLSSALDDQFTELENIFGQKGAFLAAQSHMAAIDRIEEIIAAENIDCDFRRLNGYFFNASQDGEVDMDAELAAAKRACIPGVAKIAHAPFPGITTGEAIVFPRQAIFHPLKYLHGLAQAAKRYGARIYTETNVNHIDKSHTLRVHTDRGIILANHVVVATNSPIVKTTVLAKNEPYRSYAIAMRGPANAIPTALYWDTENPYNHICVFPAGDGENFYIAGGEDHHTGAAITENDYTLKFMHLESWARRHVPLLGKVEYKWSGQIMEPVDSLAFIGRARHGENIYVVTGGSGHGLTHGTIASVLLSDMIAGRKNAWEKIYHPHRLFNGSLRDMAKHNARFLSSFVDYFVPRQENIVTAQMLTPGQGAIVEKMSGKEAMYCDASGNIHRFSARCPHMNGLLSWNELEKTWDCECHGSRFTPQGDVISGPASHGMQAK